MAADDDLENKRLLDEREVANPEHGDLSAAPKASHCCISRSEVVNLLVLSVSFFLISTPFNAICNLESTLNEAEKLGATSLATLFSVYTIACLAAPPVCVALGNKAAMLISSVFVAFFVAAHLQPRWFTLLPASASVGLWCAFLWASQAVYLTKLAFSYAQRQGTHLLAYLGLFNGVFWLFVQSAQISGNSISAVVLRHGDTPESLRLLFFIFLGCAVLGTLLLLFLFEEEVVRTPEEQERNSFWSMSRTIGGMCFRWEMLMLLPVTLFSGLEQGYVASDFTRDYVRVSLGIHEIGSVMALFGLADALASLILGQASDFVGYAPVMALGFACHGAVCGLLLTWTGASGAYTFLYTCAVLWGIGDAVWNTQLMAIVGALFMDEPEAAFAIIKMVQGAGVAIAFFASPKPMLATKLYVMLAVQAIAAVGCFFLDGSFRAPCVSFCRAVSYATSIAAKHTPGRRALERARRKAAGAEGGSDGTPSSDASKHKSSQEPCLSSVEDGETRMPSEDINAGAPCSDASPPIPTH